jgi:glycosyltransferase involved in cell wall biosynthesis
VTGHPDRPEAETFIGLAARGYPIHVCCAPDAANFPLLEAAPVEVVPFEIGGRYDPRAVARLRRKIAEFKPDILHLFNNRAVLNGLIAARGARVKIVAYRGNVGNVSAFDPLAWLRYLNPRIDRIICVSDAVRDSLARVGVPGLRIHSRKLVTIHKGHDLSWYSAAPADLVAAGVPADAFVVGCVANWRPRKGIEVLIDACEQLAVDVPVHLVLVGKMGNPKLAKRIAGCGWRERIHLLGYREDAAAVAGAFDVAVLPALRREGLPKTVIEAMAYGVPTVATRVGGVSELIEDGVSGLIVPPGDARALGAAIRRLTASADLRASLGTQGRERIRTAFRIDATIAKTAAVYGDLVG